ncbi:hypothetical protein MASR1M68_05000 [Elusimicrobiota bacterium]
MKILNYFSNITGRKAVFIIILIACFHFINSLIVLETNKFYSNPDESVTGILDMLCSFGQEYNLVRLVDKPNPVSEIFSGFIDYWKPPFYFLTALPFLYFIYDINLFICILNFFISLITLLSVYGIVSKLISKQAGLFATFILSLCPVFFTMHRTFFIETMLATTLSLSLYVIISHRDDIKLSGFQLVFVLALGLLTKEQFYIYMPVLLAFAVFYGKSLNIKNFTKILLLFFIATALAHLAWYYYLPNNIFVHLLNFSKIKDVPDYLFYFKDFYFFSLTPVVFIFWIIATIFFVVKKKNYIWISAPLFILFLFSLSTNKVTRHIFPVIIFIPIIITLFIYELKNIILKKSIIIFLITLMLFQFFLINYSSLRCYREKNFNDFNQFGALSFAFYVPESETYGHKYNMLRKILCKYSIQKTAFIHVFIPIVYNFLTLQKDRNSNIVDAFTYESFDDLIGNINSYTHIVISDKNMDLFSKFDDWSSKNRNFKKTQKINWHINLNHNDTIWLYQ